MKYPSAELSVICPSVVVTEAAWKAMQRYVQLCDHEISGLGTVIRDGDRLVVEEVFLLEQEVSASTTDLDPLALAGFVTQWVQAGRDPAVLRFWWHSHVRMPTFWSSVDLATINSLAQGGFFLTMVLNKLGAVRVRLTVDGPVPIAVDSLPFEVEEDLGTARLAAAAQEIADKVKTLGPFRNILQRRRAAKQPAVETQLVGTLAGLKGGDNE